MIAPGYAAKPPDYFRSRRTEIEPLLPARAGRVLDIGCGAGETLRYLEASGRASWTCGIEQSRAAADEARKHVDEVHVGDVEAMDLPFAPASFDLVLALDVLEHLADPWTTARRLAALVKPGGHLIASIPNVRHVSVVAPLVLLGRWRYVPAGVLDQTHLRFFTKRSAVALIESTGLRVDATRSIGGSLASEVLRRISLGPVRSFFELQYLLRAVRE